MIYMVLMYNFIPGMMANMALIVNLFFTLGILTSFQAALTMSGLAGMVLSLGTAVDANVLIYERTKEELRSGKNIKAAISAGYSNAFSAIFDSNLTSIITGVILLVFGTGPIRGFATTWIIGICCSFFTAVFLTRIVYENRINKDKWNSLTDAQKAAVKDAIAYAATVNDTLRIASEEAAVAYLEGKGCTVTYPDLPDFIAHVQQYYADHPEQTETWDMDLYNEIQALAE